MASFSTSQVLFIQQYTFVKIIFVSWDDDKLFFMSSLAYFSHDVFDDYQSTRPITTELGFSNVSLLQDKQISNSHGAAI